MKNRFRYFAFLIGIIFSLSLSPAYARSNSGSSEMVRLSQMRLAELGYYAGKYDGKMGARTRAAIKGFQSFNHLPASGKLTTQTYDLLVTAHYKQSQKTITPPASNEPVKKVVDLTPQNTWHFVNAQSLPVRFGELKVDEDALGAMHRFTVTMNGTPFLRINNQPGDLRISKVFELKGEDAVIITAYRGEEDCAYRNYLVTIPSSGAAASHHEFASCAPSSTVNEAYNALFVSFPATVNKDGWASWDVWRYENTKLVRL